MSPASQGETPEQETAAEATAGASQLRRRHKSSQPRRPSRRPAADAAVADEGVEAGRPPRRKRQAGQKAAAAASAEAAKPAARSGGRPAKSPAKAPAKSPAKKAKAPAASTAVDVDLPAYIFDTKVNVPLIHQVVVAQQAAARQGTHATKTRGDVRGGGKKPYRQKGTGRARQGSTRAPQFAGGGVVHGPVSRSHAQKTPKKMKVAALRGALSDRARHGLVQVVDGFVDGGGAEDRRCGIGAERGHRIGGEHGDASWSSRTARTRSPGRACATPGACT